MTGHGTGGGCETPRGEPSPSPSRDKSHSGDGSPDGHPRHVVLLPGMSYVCPGYACLTVDANRSHVLVLNASTGPDGSLESRVRIMSGAAAISTQLPPPLPE